MPYESTAQRRAKAEKSERRFKTIRNSVIALAFVGAGGYFGSGYIEEAAEGTAMEPVVETVMGAFNAMTEETEPSIVYAFADLEKAAETLGITDFEPGKGSFELKTFMSYNDFLNTLEASIKKGENTILVAALATTKDFHDSFYALHLWDAIRSSNLDAMKMLLSTPEISQGSEEVKFVQNDLSPEQEEAAMEMIDRLDEGMTAQAEILASALSKAALERAMLLEGSSMPDDINEVFASELAERKAQEEKSGWSFSTGLFSKAIPG